VLRLARVSVVGYDYLFAAFAFVLGAVVGSFLNVCIYRLPRDLSINEPKRSFCPHCGAQIPWYHNLPLVSWVWLRGRCARCGSPISLRYVVVEFLTALLFLGVWLKVTPDLWVLAFPYWILVSLLIVGTFVDLEHYIIPNEITVGGIIAGFFLSIAIPPMMMTESHVVSALRSLTGAALGYLLLWGVVEIGKLAFGKKRITLDEPQAFTAKSESEQWQIKIGNEVTLWGDLFARERDQLLLNCAKAKVEGREHSDVTLRFFHDRVCVGEEEYSLEKLDEISGIVRAITIPREAMGFGDVKFIAAIGAFLGWQAVLFTVVSASVIGSVAGVATLLAGKRAWSLKIPFGPYLAVGAILWIFAGWPIVNWYLTLLSPAGG
jgi:leader peptidase (prepilin peptidase) / N-methyltransferase